ILNNVLTEGKDMNHYKQNMPVEIAGIIGKLEKDKMLGYSDIILNLYELSEEGRAKLVSGFKACKEAYHDPSKKVQTISEIDNDIIVHFTVSNSNNYTRDMWIANSRII